jgi:hypothetical protein
MADLGSDMHTNEGGEVHIKAIDPSSEIVAETNPNLDEIHIHNDDDDAGASEVDEGIKVGAGEVDKGIKEQDRVIDDNDSVVIVDVESDDDDNNDDNDDDNDDENHTHHNNNGADATFIQNNDIISYIPRKEISAKFLEGPASITNNSKFIAHQKLGGGVGMYFFAATLMGHGEDIFLIEFGDIFEELVLLTNAYSDVLDDIQCVFVKKSWLLEHCPETDESGGNHSNMIGG